MKLTAQNLHDLCEVAETAASEAAALIARTVPETLTIERKAEAVSLASEVVSQLDRDAEKVILDILQDSCVKFDLGLLAEESEDSQNRFEKDYFWCIDPLDGTLPFLEGKPGYAVSIALISRVGVPLIGVVADPLTGTQYQAIQNQGAQINGKPFSVKTGKQPLNIFTDRSMGKHPLFDKCIKDLGPVKIHPPAGAVMNVCNMLTHAPSCYFKFPKPENGGGSIWDYAATACITEAAGGKVTDIHGQALDLNRKQSTFMNHRGFIFATHPDLHAQVEAVVSNHWG